MKARLLVIMFSMLVSSFVLAPAHTDYPDDSYSVILDEGQIIYRQGFGWFLAVTMECQCLASTEPEYHLEYATVVGSYRFSEDPPDYKIEVHQWNTIPGAITILYPIADNDWGKCINVVVKLQFNCHEATGIPQYQFDAAQKNYYIPAAIPGIQ